MCCQVGILVYSALVSNIHSCDSRAGLCKCWSVEAPGTRFNRREPFCLLCSQWPHSRHWGPGSKRKETDLECKMVSHSSGGTTGGRGKEVGEWEGGQSLEFRGSSCRQEMVWQEMVGWGDPKGTNKRN